MRVFYHHIPRTGGNFIRRIAEKEYKDNFFTISSYEHLNLYDFIKNKENFFIYCDSLLFSRFRRKILKILKICDVDFITIRNPTSRFESFYNIWVDKFPDLCPYQIGNHKLSIDEFYIKCKEQNNRLFLNCQYLYFKMYNPNYIISTHNLSFDINFLKNSGVFTTICNEDFSPINHSINNHKLSNFIIKDYKNFYPEDFQLNLNIAINT